MKLTKPQVQRFWREWAETCRVRGWTREAGMTAAQIDAKRKELLSACGFSSLTLVDKVAGFTRVLHEVIAARGVSLESAQETIDPALNEARVLRHGILTDLVPCLELYEEDVKAYLTTIIEAKTRYRKTDRPTKDLNLMDLTAGQLRQTRFTLCARLNDKRNAAGESIHEMRVRAKVPCKCAECRPVAVAETDADALEPFPF